MQQDPYALLGSILSGQSLPAAQTRSGMNFMGAAQKQGRQPVANGTAMPQMQTAQPVSAGGINPALQAVTKTVTDNGGKGDGKGKGKGDGKGKGVGVSVSVGVDDHRFGVGDGKGDGKGKGKGKGKGDNKGGNGGQNLSAFEEKMNVIARKGPQAYTPAIEKNLGLSDKTIGYGGGQPKQQRTGMASKDFMNIFSAPSMTSAPQPTDSAPTPTPQWPGQGEIDPGKNPIPAPVNPPGHQPDFAGLLGAMTPKPDPLATGTQPNPMLPQTGRKPAFTPSAMGNNKLF